MEDLLMNNYTAHYGLLVPTITNFIVETDIPYLEIEDTHTGELVVHNVRGTGIANFANNNRINLTIVNYDKFVTHLLHSFQRGKKRCDVLMCCDIGRYFILGELKDRYPNTKVRKGAKEQLIASLKTLLAVQEIAEFAHNKSIKRCCYFNKQSTSPTLLTATNAFNRLNMLYPDGFKMSNKDIEDQGFEFYEYTGGQTMTLTR